jgi:hypothetical protein
MQAQSNIGIFCGVRRGLFEINLIKGELLRTFAG